MAASQDDLLAGIDALEAAFEAVPSRGRRLWGQIWPKVAAVALAIFAWQCVVWTHWKPEFILPGPGKAFPALWTLMKTGEFWTTILRTLGRGVRGYLVAVVIGTIVGLAVARVKVLRVAVGSMITGLQTMPSVAWFPLAIVVFKLGEGAIMFVVVLGAAPSIANGIITGVDHVPPLLLRSGRMLGARGLAAYRHVVIPAALPSFVGGLKQGWAFAWRSLMAGELIAQIPGHAGIGTGLDNARSQSDYPTMIAWMIVLLALGILIDALFTNADVRLRRRWGLLTA